MGLLFSANQFISLPLNPTMGVQGQSSSTKSRLIFLVVLAIHLLVLYVAMRFDWHVKRARENAFTHTHLIKIDPPSEKSDSLILAEPNLHLSLTSRAIALPPIIVESLPEDPSTAVNPIVDSTYEIPSLRDNRYSHIVDPKLREKLKSLRKIEFTPIGYKKSARGDNWVYLGDGLCAIPVISSSGKPEAGEVHIKCALTESEQMMKNVEDALADPLHIR